MYGGLMGMVLHRIHDPVSNPAEKYAVYDAYGRMMAETKQQDDIDRHLSMFTPQNVKTFTMKRSHNLLKDNWSV